MKGIQFIPDGLHINFVALRYVAFAVSLAAILASVFLIGTRGLNFGIDFTGGTLIEIKTPSTPDLGKMRTDLNDLGLGAISLQEFGAPDNLLIRLPQQMEETPEATLASEKIAQKTVRALLDKEFAPEIVDYRRSEFVGPQVGEELKKKGFYAVLFSLAGILIYVWIRFEWQFGVAAVVALAHDAVITIGLFSLLQMEFNLATVAAVLTIAGYSINDTVVIFDRIREELRRYKKMPLAEVLNMAINKTLSRSLMTSVTTMLALVALYVFGGEVLRGFIVALIFGVVVGTYSSVFVAAPILLYLNVRRGAKAVVPEES